MPLKPPSSFAKPSEAGQTPEAKGEGKMLGSEPFRWGEEPHPENQPVKIIHQKIIKQWVYLLGLFPTFTWLFEGGSLNTAVGAGPLHPNVDLPTLDYRGVRGEVRQ